MGKTYNLQSKMRKIATQIPNGTSVSEIPNGSEFGNSPGILLNDDEGLSDKTPLKDVIGEVLLAAANGEDQSAIASIARQAKNIEIPPELEGNDGVFKMVMALGRKADENQNIHTRNIDTGEKERTLDQLAAEIA